MEERPTTASAPLTHVMQALRGGVESDDRAQSLLDGAGQAMVVLDADVRVIAANARAEALLDAERADLLGRDFADLLASEDRERIRGQLARAIATHQGSQDREATLLRFSGDPQRVGFTLLPFRARDETRLAMLIRDLQLERAERKLEVHDLEARLATSEGIRHRDRKLTDLGSLLSVVAHELRSPLTYAANIASHERRMLERLARAHPEAAADVARILDEHKHLAEGLDRMTRLLKELQPLTRNRASERAQVDLAALVKDAVRTFRASARPRPKVDLDLQHTHPVMVDLGEMRRVLLNLLQNAHDATGGKGRIRVETRNQDLPPTIRVIDEGPGLPPGLEERIFEPFFTTKADGTGLGLAISRRIVEAHGGSLRHERPAVGGACFVIELPPHKP